MYSCQVRGFGWVATSGFGCGHRDPFPGFAAGALPQLQRQDLFDKPDRRFGRMDPFSRLGLAAITLALRDADLEQWQDKRAFGLLADSWSGCLETDCDYFNTVIPEHGALASPQLFAYTLSNTFLGEAALRFGLTGNCQVVNQTGDEPLALLHTALNQLQWREDEAVVMGYCDLSAQGPLAAPGALFMVLDPSSEGLGHGGLKRDDSGAVTFNGQPLETVDQLLGLLSRSLTQSLKI